MEDNGAEQIAAEWGVSVDILREATWELQERDGNNSEAYGYFVRFDEDNDPAILAELGLKPGQFLREVSINAFDDVGYVEDGYVEDGYVGHDEPASVSSAGSFAAFAGDSFAEQAFAAPRASSAFVTADNGDITADSGVEPEVVTFRGEPVTHLGEPVTYTPRKADDGIYSINQPLPDIADLVEDDEIENPPGRAYLTDEKDRILTDEQGQGLVVDAPASSGAIGGVALNEYVINGPTYAGASFATRSTFPNQAGDIEALRRDMFSRLDELEAVVRRSASLAPNRGHNHPPELLEIERPVTQKQFREVMTAIGEVRKEGESATPDSAKVVAHASTLRRIALWLGSAIASGIIGQEAANAYTAQKQQIYEALLGAAESMMAWVQHLPQSF